MLRYWSRLPASPLLTFDSYAAGDHRHVSVNPHLHVLGFSLIESSEVAPDLEMGQALSLRVCLSRAIRECKNVTGPDLLQSLPRHVEAMPSGHTS